MSKNSIIPFLKDYLINFLIRPFLLDTNDKTTKTNRYKTNSLTYRLMLSEIYLNIHKCIYPL